MLNTIKKIITPVKASTKQVKLRCNEFISRFSVHSGKCSIGAHACSRIDANQTLHSCDGRISGLLQGPVMMHACPHCQEPHIGSTMKVSTLVLSRPLQCPHCGKLSFVPLRYGVLALFTWVVLSWVFILTALYFRNVLYLLGTVPAAVFALDKWILKAPLVKFDE